MFVNSIEIMLLNVPKEKFCLVLNQFFYIGDVSGDTSPIIWQRVNEWNVEFSPQGDGRSGPWGPLLPVINLTLLRWLRAIFCKSHPTCDSRVFRISSYFNQLKIKVILEDGRNFSFIKHFVEFLGGSRENSSFSRNAVSVPKLYFESHLRLLELLFRVQLTFTWTLLGTEHNIKKSRLSLLKIILFYWPKYLTSWKFDKTCQLYFKV